MNVYVFEIWDLIPYFLLWLLLLFYAFDKRLNATSATNLMGGVILLFTSLRYGIGYDYMEYVEIVNGSEKLENMEPICQLLMSICGGIHFQFFFIVTSFLIYCPIIYVSRKLSYDARLSILIYVFFPLFFLNSISVIRNSVAYSFVFLSFYYLINKNRIKGTLCFIFAIGFHYSAITALVLYPISKLKLGRNSFTILYIFSFVLSLLVVSVFSSLTSDNDYIAKMIRYSEREASGGFMMNILVNLVGLLILLYWNKINNVVNPKPYLLKVCIAGVIIWNIFSINPTIRERFSMFYLLFLLLLIPEFLKISPSIAYFKKRTISLFFFLLICFSFTINILGNLNDRGRISFLPYQTIFYYKEYPY